MALAEIRRIDPEKWAAGGSDDDDEVEFEKVLDDWLDEGEDERTRRTKSQSQLRFLKDGRRLC